MADQHRRTYVLFTVLAIYIVLQFIWWAVLLMRKEEAVAQLGMQVTALGGRPVTVVDGQRAMRMIVGEGIVFLLIVLVVLYLTLRAIRRDLALARSQRNFLLAVTHELRSPIAAIKLQLQTMERKGVSEEMKRRLHEQAVQETDRLADLTEKVLKATRAEEKKHDLDLEPVELMGLMRSVLERARVQMAPEHDLVLEGPEHCEVITDPGSIRTIMDNLIENAAKYSPPGTSITVVVVQRREGWRISVCDEGAGIAMGEREMIFEKFYRGGNEETRRAKGTGLGLYIVKQVARELGGDVTVRPRDGGGSIFVASFPNQ